MTCCLLLVSLVISPWLYSVENPRLIAVHIQDLFDVFYLFGLILLSVISNFVLFARVSSALIIYVVLRGLIPSSNAGLCLSLSDRHIIQILCELVYCTLL